MPNIAHNPKHWRHRTDAHPPRQEYAIKNKDGNYWVTFFGTGTKVSGYMGSRDLAEVWIARRRVREKGGVIDCITCSQPFKSPDRIAIRMCSGCKARA